MREGISSQRPEQGSKRQPWYLHWTVSPSNQPAESGMPRCGQRSRRAKRLPSRLRPMRSGMLRRVVVTRLAEGVGAERGVPVVVDEVGGRAGARGGVELDEGGLAAGGDGAHAGHRG